MDKVAIIILNWNGKAFLEKFLPSVIQFSPGVKVIVADNKSTDDSILFLKSNYPSVGLILLEENYGYSKGYNKAIEQVDAEYFVLLNSDIEVTAHWIEPIVKLMDSNLEIAACQPKILDFNNREYFEYAGAAGGYIDWLGYPFCRGRIFDTLEKDKGQYDANQEIFWATGACLFIKAKAFHEVGGLDDDFFAHLEEIDLCWRLKSAGYKVYFCGESKIYHVGGGTLNKINPRKTFLNFRNSLFMLMKNLTWSHLILIIFLRLILDGVAGIKFLLEGSWKHTVAVIKAHFAFYGAIPMLMKKRNQNKIHNLTFLQVFKKSIVIQYFLLRKSAYTEIEF